MARLLVGRYVHPTAPQVVTHSLSLTLPRFVSKLLLEWRRRWRSKLEREPREVSLWSDAYNDVGAFHMICTMYTLVALKCNHDVQNSSVRCGVLR